MRDVFPGHYRPQPAALQQMWKEGFITLDTSVLLDVFRVSEETASQLLDTLGKLREQLWLPYDVAREYHEHVEGVIADQAKPYDDAVKQLNGLLNLFAAPRSHPFIEAPLLNETQALFRRLEMSLAQRKEQLQELLSSNPLKERLADLFSGRVGEPFTAEQLEAIYQEGRERFAKKVPPGYADAKDKPEPRCFGDLIIWKAILAKLSVDARPGLLVTGDVKEDWFQRVSGRTVGPRPELVAEAKRQSGADFYLYATPAFLHYANEFLGASVDRDAIREVQDLESQRQQRLRDSRMRVHQLRRYLSHAAGTDAQVMRMRRVPHRPAFWAAELSDGRRALIDERNPRVHAIFTLADHGFSLDRLSEHFSDLATPEEVGGAAWIQRALRMFGPTEHSVEGESDRTRSQDTSDGAPVSDNDARETAQEA